MRSQMQNIRIKTNNNNQNYKMTRKRTKLIHSKMRTI